MFKQSVKLCSSTSLNNFSALLRNCVCSVSTQAPQIHKWDLLSAVCLERHPVITKPMNEIETKFQRMLNEIEFEGSMKSDHEVRMEMEKKQSELQKQNLLDVDIEATPKQSAQDLEDAGEAELAAFQFAPRVTEADKQNLKDSLERKLDKCLVLLVEQKVGDDSFWLPPQANRLDGETMRQTADRVMRETFEDNLKVRIYGNAPMGVYKYVYPKSVRENGSHGAKIFYYLARYLNGNVPQALKHQWLDRDELQETLPEPIHKTVSMFLVPE